jgi:hypothetical protein
VSDLPGALEKIDAEPHRSVLQTDVGVRSEKFSQQLSAMTRSLQHECRLVEIVEVDENCCLRDCSLRIRRRAVD